jgi:hypothetical protein
MDDRFYRFYRFLWIVDANSSGDQLAAFPVRYWAAWFQQRCGGSKLLSSLSLSWAFILCTLFYIAFSLVYLPFHSHFILVALASGLFVKAYDTLILLFYVTGVRCVGRGDDAYVSVELLIHMVIHMDIRTYGYTYVP